MSLLASLRSFLMSSDHGSDHGHGSPCDDDESYISSASTYNSFTIDPHGHFEMCDHFDDGDGERSCNMIEAVEDNSPEVYQLSVYNSGKDWARLGRAVGQHEYIKVFRVFAGEGGGDGPVRTTEVVDAFCAGLAQNRTIQVFHSEDLEFTSGQIQIMRPFFSQNAELTEIKLKCNELECGDIRVLAEAVKERGGNTRTIRSFSYSSDVASASHIAALLDLAKACTHLTSLSLRGLRSSSDLSSCEAMVSFLSSKKCTLIKLHLIGNPINDAGCRIIAESLRNNRRLREIRIKESNRSSANITDQAYAAFVRVVCDTSSIESTLTSNHTLADVSCNYISKPPELRAILDMNRGFDKRTVAKLKVLRYHFKGNFNMSAIAGLDTKALPYLLAWFNRLRSRIAYYHQDKRRWCNSVLYRIIRHNPGLCSYPSPEKLIRLKAENQVATLSCELKDARKQIEALKREVEELRSDKRRKIGAK